MNDNYKCEMRKQALDNISMMIECATSDNIYSKWTKDYYEHRLNGAVAMVFYLGLITYREREALETKIEEAINLQYMLKE